MESCLARGKGTEQTKNIKWPLGFLLLLEYGVSSRAPNSESPKAREPNERQEPRSPKSPKGPHPHLDLPTYFRFGSVLDSLAKQYKPKKELHWKVQAYFIETPHSMACPWYVPDFIDAQGTWRVH